MNYGEIDIEYLEKIPNTNKRWEYMGSWNGCTTHMVWEGRNINFKKFKLFLSEYNAYIIHYFVGPETLDCVISYYENRTEYKYSPRFLIDNYGNIYNIRQKFTYPKDSRGSNEQPPQVEVDFKDMYMNYKYKNSLSNESIKIIKYMDPNLIIEENNMIIFIKNLLENNDLKQNETISKLEENQKVIELKHQK